MSDMNYFAKMVDNKESSANWCDLFDLAMVMWKMATVTNRGKVANFATFHYSAEHYTKETEKKRMDNKHTCSSWLPLTVLIE